ncbi:hypothetical protein LUZ61_013663 [Rhynchospora tenuis]|uniref:DUF6598 domain-containing protein n=1 Tax=Rhynchospora tenuis TaxID=198213 RepID=A0AAD5W9V6_9POAL|nr:hypothetical protein LUZ61_013663 [Rhynchospora tenuis]
MLVEVYDVTVDLSGKTGGNIHGKVSLDCMIYQIDLFNRDKESAHVIQEKLGSLPLDSPDLAPLGYDPGAIIFNLKIDDEELCKEVITWNPDYVRTNEWLEKEVQGRNGSVLVTYAVMLEACLAEVDVKLIQCVQQTTPLRIHGDIVVYINDMTYLRYFAFSKKSDNCTIIKPLDPIPLSRSLFTCRLGSHLVVKVDLCNSDTSESLVCGALLFPLEYYGEFVGTLGDQNKIQVKVNWLFHTKHPKTAEIINYYSYIK